MHCTQVMLLLGRTFEAVTCATQAMQLDASWPDGHLTLGRAQMELGEVYTS